MGPAGDDGVVDPQQHPDAGDGHSFDPNLETGYLRRAPRDHELDSELGSTPFDPGPGHYDERRASRDATRRQREARRRQRAELRVQETRAKAQRLDAGRAQAAAVQPVPEPDRALAPMPPEPEQEAASVTELRPRREREALRPARRPASALVDPSVKGPVKKRVRAAENRRRVAGRRRGLLWPTAKAGLAVSVALALGAGLGSLLGLPEPWLDQTAGNGSLVNSASLFGIDPGTPAGLVKGYVFPILGPHDFGEKDARFGASRYGHVHEGQDIFGKVGTPELAVHDGIVVDRGKTNGRYSGGRGNYLAIYSPDDNHSFVYMHMLKPSTVQLGDRVHAGQVVGQLGCTGSCEGPHLHFEVRVGKASLGADTKAVDPLPFLRQWPQSTPG